MTISIRASFLLCSSATLGFDFDLIGQNRPSQTPLFKAVVEMVYIKVSVSDPLNRLVTGLEKEHFRVYEDKIEQNITHFSQQSAPISAGFIFDVSASMKDNNNIKKAKAAITRFFESGNPEDDFFLITFNQTTRLVQPFTDSGSTVQNKAAMQKPGGRTALYDAIYMGLDQVKLGKNEKKALILITDGEDNSSRYSPAEVNEFAKESNVQVYGIGEQGMLGYGRWEIQKIVNITGGRSYFPNTFNELDYYIDLVHAELRNQYVLGYTPTNKIHDGKWRQIKVKLDAPQGLPKLVVRTKEDYYAPKN